MSKVHLWPPHKWRHTGTGREKREGRTRGGREREKELKNMKTKPTYMPTVRTPEAPGLP